MNRLVAEQLPRESIDTLSTMRAPSPRRRPPTASAILESE